MEELLSDGDFDGALGNRPRRTTQEKREDLNLASVFSPKLKNILILV